MEKSYIFVLYVNGKICKAYNWFCENERVAHLQAIGLCAGAKTFKKTAGVLIYELREDLNYHVCNSVDFRSDWYILHNKFSSHLLEKKCNLTDVLKKIIIEHSI